MAFKARGGLGLPREWVREEWADLEAMAPSCPRPLPLPISGLKKVKSEVAQSCPTFCDPMECSLPGSSLHGILQARILEWVAISFSRGSSQLRDRTWVSCIAGRHFNL